MPKPQQEVEATVRSAASGFARLMEGIIKNVSRLTSLMQPAAKHLDSALGDAYKHNNDLQQGQRRSWNLDASNDDPDKSPPTTPTP